VEEGRRRAEEGRGRSMTSGTMLHIYRLGCRIGVCRSASLDSDVLDVGDVVFRFQDKRVGVREENGRQS